MEQVWDWDRWTSHDLVGTVEVTQDKVLEVLGKQDGHETHMDLAILDSCCPPMPVLDKKKRSSTLHLCLSTLRQVVHQGRHRSCVCVRACVRACVRCVVLFTRSVHAQARRASAVGDEECCY